MYCLPTPVVPVSWGELLDKLTILEIKARRIASSSARSNVDREYRQLRAIAQDLLEAPDLLPLLRQLRQVNEQLWDIEDRIRIEEAADRFGSTFVGLARAVYRTNDRRAEIKREINHLLASGLVEEKSYVSLRHPGGDAAGVAAGGLAAGHVH
jgi:hypothetical protein